MKAGFGKIVVCSLAVLMVCLLFVKQTTLKAHAQEIFYVPAHGISFEEFFDDYDEWFFYSWFLDSNQTHFTYYYDEPEIKFDEDYWFPGEVTYPSFFMVTAPPVESFIPQNAAVQSQVQAPAQDKAGAVLDAVNAARAQYGLTPLAYDGGLQYCADVRANEMPSSYSHTRPDGSAWYTVNPNIMFGENLLMTTDTLDANAIVDHWMQSPVHRALILDASFSRAGVAGSSGNGCEYWVLEFGY